MLPYTIEKKGIHSRRFNFLHNRFLKKIRYKKVDIHYLIIKHESVIQYSCIKKLGLKTHTNYTLFDSNRVNDQKIPQLCQYVTNTYHLTCFSFSTIVVVFLSFTHSNKRIEKYTSEKAGVHIYQTQQTHATSSWVTPYRNAG
jgi:hypothetical protein